MWCNHLLGSRGQLLVQSFRDLKTFLWKKNWFCVHPGSLCLILHFVYKSETIQCDTYAIFEIKKGHYFVKSFCFVIMPFMWYLLLQHKHCIEYAHPGTPLCHIWHTAPRRWKTIINNKRELTRYGYHRMINIFWLQVQFIIFSREHGVGISSYFDPFNIPAYLLTKG